MPTSNHSAHQATFDSFATAVFNLCGKFRFQQLDGTMSIIGVGLHAARDLSPEEFAQLLAFTLGGLAMAAAQVGMSSDQLQQSLEQLTLPQAMRDGSSN